MFTDISAPTGAADAAKSNKRARGAGDCPAAATEDLPMGKLDRQMQKLILAAALMALQDHVTLKHNMLDENVVIRVASDHLLAQRL